MIKELLLISSYQRILWGKRDLLLDSPNPPFYYLKFLYRNYINGNRTYCKFFIFFKKEKRMSFEKIVKTMIENRAYREDIEIIKTLKNWDEFIAHKKANHWLYCYAKYITKGRWIEAEEHIVKNSELVFWYASDVIKGRWPEAEKYIIKDPKWAYFYARDIIEGRWPEAEKYIMRDPMYIHRYIEDIVQKVLYSNVENLDEHTKILKRILKAIPI
jgi:hypothetical protein